MPVSSTLSTSAPKSASRSEQKPPGSRRERSSTRMPSSARLIAPGGQLTVGSGQKLLAMALPTAHCPPSYLHPPWCAQQLARLPDAGRPAAHALQDLARLGDEVAVRARHLAVREIEVVL